MTEIEWRRKFAQQLIDRGVDRDTANDCAENAEYAPEERPDVAADDELSYWDDDE